jgi:hypothetical protein
MRTLVLYLITNAMTIQRKLGIAVGGMYYALDYRTRKTKRSGDFVLAPIDSATRSHPTAGD